MHSPDVEPLGTLRKGSWQAIAGFQTIISAATKYFFSVWYHCHERQWSTLTVYLKGFLVVPIKCERWLEWLTGCVYRIRNETYSDRLSVSTGWPSLPWQRWTNSFVCFAILDSFFVTNSSKIPSAFELYADFKGNSGDEAVQFFKDTFSQDNVKVHFLGAWCVNYRGAYLYEWLIKVHSGIPSRLWEYSEKRTFPQRTSWIPVSVIFDMLSRWMSVVSSIFPSMYAAGSHIIRQIVK